MFAALIDLVLPRRCLGCGRPGAGLCPPCRPLRDIQRLLPGPGVVHAAGEYAGAVRLAIIHYKERGRRDLVRDLAPLLGAAVEHARAAAAVDVLVPVPSSRAAARRRGGEHMVRLAERATGDLRVENPLRLLRRIADTAGLGIRERRENVHGAFRAAAPAGPRRALLVDDVVTTGASLQEAARALQAAGWTVAGAAVIAATPRPGRGAGPVLTPGSGFGATIADRPIVAPKPVSGRGTRSAISQVSQ